MANRKPIVHVPSNAAPLQRLQSGDTIESGDVENLVDALADIAAIEADYVAAPSTLVAAERIPVATGNNREVEASSASIETAGSFFRLLITQTASDPVLIGNLTGRNASFGAAVICIGQDAGGDTTGTLTTTLGARATCIGRGAGSAGGAANSVVGADCFLVGQFAGARGTLGTDCLGVGNFTMFGATLGNANICIGGSALSSTTAGAANVCIGSNTGRGLNNASAGFNTFVGNGAGATGIGQATNVSSSTAIGATAFTEFSNQVAIGGAATTLITARTDTEIRDGTTAVSLTVYETYTSATNYERFQIHFDSNVCRLETQDGSGGGTASDLALGTDSTTRITFHADGTITLNTEGNLPTSDPGVLGELWLKTDVDGDLVLAVSPGP